MSDSVRPHRQQPTRFPHPWDSPGKNTGVGCHFLLQCMKVKSEREVAQLCPTLSDPMDCSIRGSSVHGIFQARVLLGSNSFQFITGELMQLFIIPLLNLEKRNFGAQALNTLAVLNILTQEYRKTFYIFVSSSIFFSINDLVSIFYLLH